MLCHFIYSYICVRILLVVIENNQLHILLKNQRYCNIEIKEVASIYIHNIFITNDYIIIIVIILYAHYDKV